MSLSMIAGPSRPSALLLRRAPTIVLAALLAQGAGCSAVSRRAPVDAGAAATSPFSLEGLRVEEPTLVLHPTAGSLLLHGAVSRDGAADIVLRPVPLAPAPVSCLPGASAETAEPPEADAASRGIDAAAPARPARPPVRVNPVAGSAVAGRQVGPRAVVLPGGRIVVAWVDRGRDPSGDIVVAGSDDAGLVFEPPERITDEPGLCGQEYADLALLQDGTLLAVWLDEREATAETPNEKQVYSAFSRDGGRSWSRNLPVTRSLGGVCPCCRPALAARAGGGCELLYRDREGEMLTLQARRLLRVEDGFGPPLPVSGRPWRFNACPTDAPALLTLADGSVLASWMDGACGEPSIWLARQGDGGWADASRARVATEGRPGRPSLAAGSQGATLLGHEDEEGRVWARRADRDGAAPVLLGGSGEARARGIHLAPVADGWVALWVEDRWEETPEHPAGWLTTRLGQAWLRLEGGSLTIARSDPQPTPEPAEP